MNIELTSGNEIEFEKLAANLRELPVEHWIWSTDRDHGDEVKFALQHEECPGGISFPWFALNFDPASDKYNEISLFPPDHPDFKFSSQYFEGPAVDELFYKIKDEMAEKRA